MGEKKTTIDSGSNGSTTITFFVNAFESIHYDTIPHDDKESCDSREWRQYQQKFIPHQHIHVDIFIAYITEVLYLCYTNRMNS